MSKEELIQFEGLVIEILPDARYRVQLDAGYEVLAYTVALLRWEPARLASKQSFPVDFRDRIQHERKTGRPRDCDIRLRHTRRAVHGQAQGRGTTAAALSPLCDPTATASVGLIASGRCVSLIVAEDFQGFDAVAPSRAVAAQVLQS